MTATTLMRDLLPAFQSRRDGASTQPPIAIRFGEGEQSEVRRFSGWTPRRYHD
jgi:hypothetical protein